MKKRRWLRCLVSSALALAILLPLLAFGLSNLYLLSPKGRKKITDVIKVHMGMENTVQGATWSPWNGITIYGLRVEQPGPLRKKISQPLLMVEFVRVDPVWKELLEKKLNVTQIDFRKPELTLPIELLSQLPTRPIPPVVAAIQPDLAAIDPGKKPTEQAPPIIPQVPIVPDPGTPLVVPPVAKIPPAVIETVSENTAPNLWVNFSNAKLKVVSTLTDYPIYQIESIDGKLPMGGKNAETEVKVGRISSLGNTFAESMIIPIKWHSPILESGVIDCALFGIDCKLSARFGLTAGIPFHIDAALPTQENKEIHIGEKLHATLGTIAGKGQLQGYLQAPGTWEGQGIIQTLNAQIVYDERKATFDRGQAIFIFKNGALGCVDARLVGDSLSILGNAALLKDGRGAANARIVAPPETLVAISKFTLQDSTAPALTPLSTPQRAALDLQLFGRLGDFYYKPNPEAAPISIR